VQRGAGGPGRSDRVSGGGGGGGARPGASGRGPSPQSAADKAKQQYMKVMFIGTPILLVLLVGLLIWKKPWEENAPPPPAQKIYDDEKIQEVKELGSKAAKRFSQAKAASTMAEKRRGIDEAISLNRQALDKLSALSDLDRYKDESYDAVFEPIQNKLQLEYKVYREAKARAEAGEEGG
jgi:hypothetical protein